MKKKLFMLTFKVFCNMILTQVTSSSAYTTRNVTQMSEEDWAQEIFHFPQYNSYHHGRSASVLNTGREWWGLW